MEPKEPTDYYKKVLTLKDLVPGDILIFEGDKDDFASKMIMKFTNSKVSHSAMYFQDSPVTALADSGTKGLRVHEVGTKQSLRRVFVSRIAKPGNKEFFSDKELLPVLQAAKVYLDEKTDYPYGDLLALALTILFGKASFGYFDLVKVTKALVALFKLLLDTIAYHGKHPMVCSSFVYQCYMDASKKDASGKYKDLKLDVENGDIKKVKQGALQQENTPSTLFDLYAQYVVENNLHTMSLTSVEEDEAEEELSIEKIEALFEDALLENGKELTALPKIGDARSLILKLLKKVAQLMKVPVDTLNELINELRNMQSLFVTPNDLCYNVTNTVKIGYIDIERKEDNLPDNLITTKYNT